MRSNQKNFDLKGEYNFEKMPVTALFCTLNFNSGSYRPFPGLGSTEAS
jgi:hypothetical protein